MDWTYGPGGPGNHPNYPAGGNMPSSYGYEMSSNYLPPGFPCAFPPPQHPPLGYFPTVPPPLPTYPPAVPTFNWNPPQTDFQPPGEILPEAPVDEKALQRNQDEQWLSHFLQRRSREMKEEARMPKSQSHPEFGAVLRDAAALASHLSDSCRNLTDKLQEDVVAWSAAYGDALRLKQDLQDKLASLAEELEAKKRHVARVRERRLRSKQKAEMLRAEREARRAEKESVVDKWRLRQIHQVEEEKKERELKLAADSVLCEVRKKQSDIKRMQDILRSLEKLRRLRKDAATRRGVNTGEDEDTAFQRQLDELRRVIKARTDIYTTEEKALTVMLDSVQEEERRALKKERERRQKHKMDAMLFGEEAPVDPALRPYAEYYAQAESSLHALLHIRRQWDIFLVPDDHCDGTTVPPGWILPQLPSSSAWAVALVD
ncbi:programmed cell death protein 7-like isoform X1 [Syngnathus acus]|uniref:programmed cell death protein 7-like isoform X1 n=1 Tax=Syngnathus acus TaxID=161584 RepID=UPI001885BDBE|nr:programmed cell death protein 7-like isoform X1 [Syngnathus acus]